VPERGRSGRCAAGTAFTIEDGDGEVVADGELPAGRAENADPKIDWGVARIVLPGTVPLEFDAALLEGDELLQLVLSG
jgi:hypothetical protein